MANGWSVASVSSPSREHFIQHYLVCHPKSVAPRSHIEHAAAVR
jgi:hypothetical protein